MRALRMLRCTATAAFLWLATGAAAQQHQYLEASKPLAPGAVSADGTQEIRWQDLIPKNWRPKTKLLGRKLQAMNDNDPEALAFMRELQSEWDQAPTNPELEGRLVKLPGYLVPLEEVKGELKELLLVPYYGACIHVPPPPPNQIIHVTLATPIALGNLWDAYRLSGHLRIKRFEADIASASYDADAATLTAIGS